MLDAKHDGVLSTTEVLDGESDGVGVMNAVVDIGKARILDDVSVSAPKGSCLVILGPSGCGKTTLLRAIAGLQPISDGNIFLCGQEVSGSQVEIPPEQRDVGMVFQDWALFPHLTVIENIVFGLPREERKNMYYFVATWFVICFYVDYAGWITFVTIFSSRFITMRVISDTMSVPVCYGGVRPLWY